MGCFLFRIVLVWVMMEVGEFLLIWSCVLGLEQ